MVSLAKPAYNMMNHMENEEPDFALYPDPQNMFSPQSFQFGVQNFNLENNSSYPYPRPQEVFSGNADFNGAMYTTEAPQYGLESPELRGAPSNYSTASGPSATSSAAASPHSIHGHIAPGPEWGPLGLGFSPSIVGYDGYTHGNEYTVAHSGMEDFDSSLNLVKPNGFVGECQDISSSVSCQPGSAASNPMPSSSMSTSAPSPRSADSTVTLKPEASRISATSSSFNDNCFSSPVSVAPTSSTFRRPSRPFATSRVSISSSAGQPQDPRSPAASTISPTSPQLFPTGHQSLFFSQSSGNFVPPLEPSCSFPLPILPVTSYLANSTMKSNWLMFHSSDPSILHPQYTARPTSVAQSHDAYQPPTYPASPSLSHMSRSPRPIKQGSQSPYLNAPYGYPYPPPRRPSLVSHPSCSSPDSSEESKVKGRCTYPDCGRIFKDLKAHMLTHQNERPEKCPIQTCDYHIKGFARKYDKNRHTLTHYKGTMVCGFCPGSGSAAEKSFNRADVFKRHLTSVHAVEQTPPNSRKKTSSSINNGKKLSGYAPDATGKCSTCSATFGNAQDFYEHLDDCVLRIVQQEEPSEAVNAARLAEVEQDPEVHETLRNNQLPATTTNVYSADEEDDDDYEDENDDDFTLRSKASRKGRVNRNPVNGVQKSRGLTHSKGGVTLNTKGRKKRKDYPSSWGCPSSQMKLKKRVLCVFDGPRRLWKDDMMLGTDYEVRMKLNNEKAYVTDLDVQTMRRAEAFHNSTEQEKGPWIADDLTGMDLEKLMEVKQEL
ncbi:C2H2 and C2HC zinc finger [Venustampulla echinocandica]|uniref:C2H2 and C2HC zinc finger n=1 Tax=Venustampulla echinocandica TaxID=2656787 RepID=A0A370TYC4_9HELO|nr:C2H2 and C2HC zinc finger [Venustampulla echinocandica]RDL40537.1 C2H2 and C2HC zinc finger [Venustampulla echinocandica]